MPVRFQRFQPLVDRGCSVERHKESWKVTFCQEEWTDFFYHCGLQESLALPGGPPPQWFPNIWFWDCFIFLKSYRGLARLFVWTVLVSKRHAIKLTPWHDNFLMTNPTKGNKVTFNRKSKCIFQIREASEGSITKVRYSNSVTSMTGRGAWVLTCAPVLKEVRSPSGTPHCSGVRKRDWREKSHLSVTMETGLGILVEGGRDTAPPFDNCWPPYIFQSPSPDQKIHWTKAPITWKQP